VSNVQTIPRFIEAGFTIIKTMSEPLTGIQKLVAVMKQLRAPGGCPWDREQTLHSLKPCLLEETYELLDAIDKNDVTLHREELGDVLLQVVFQCAIREEEELFSFDDVATTLAEKLIRRHPHVFGDSAVSSSHEVLKNWESIKQTEKADKPKHSALDGVPHALPALLKAQRVQAKASRVGFDWQDASGAIEKIEEELQELHTAVEEGKQTEIEEETGDLLFSVVNYCRFIHVDAESALSASTQKFAKRFREVERLAKERNLEMKACTLAELDALWDEVKRQSSNTPTL
jgi:tetrapyrrole methylase family protein/MazG family protein